MKLFASLQIPKDEFSQCLVFILGYIINYFIYKTFKGREKLNNRFILDIYHIITFQFNGMFVSDYYIHQMIEKYFLEEKFLEYERNRNIFKKNIQGSKNLNSHQN